MEMGDPKAQATILAVDTLPRVKAPGTILVEGGDPMGTAEFKELGTTSVVDIGPMAAVDIKAPGTTLAVDIDRTATEGIRGRAIISVADLTSSNLQRSDTYKCSYRVSGSQKIPAE